MHFVNPGGTVQLFAVSLPFLAFDAFVYLLGALEVASALALFVGIGVRYVGVFMLGLFRER